MTNLDVMKKSIMDCISEMDIKKFMELIFLFEDNPDVIDIDRLDILTCENCKKLYGDCAVDSEFTECESRFEKFTAEERERFDQAQEDLNRYAKSKGWQSVENESQLN